MLADRRRFLTLGGAALVGLATGFRAGAEEAVVPQGLGRQSRQRVLSYVDAFTAKHGVPGLSVAYSRRGRLVYSAAFGVADPAAGEALTTAHRFRIASVTKPITSAAIMVLMDRGDIALNDRVFGQGGLLGRRFPLKEDMAHADWLREITVDHLLTHTCGGWTNDTHDPMFGSPWLDHDELIDETLARSPLINRPGSHWAYSNFGYCLLGRVIEEVSGRPYADFVKSSLLVPAGAGGMSIAGNTLADRQNGEVVYFGQGDFPYGMNVSRMDSHGGWIATATELVKFAERVDGYPSVPDLLSPQAVRTMATPSKVFSGYARGWARNPSHHNWWHIGALPGTAAILARIEGDECFAGLVNTRTPSIDGDLDRLMWNIHDQVM